MGVLQWHVMHPKQQEIFDATLKYRNVIAMCSRQFGKSTLALQRVIYHMTGMGNNGVGENCIYVAQLHSTCKKFFRDLIKMIPSENIEEANKSDLYIKLYDGGYIKFYSGRDDGDGIRGNNDITFCVLDEGAYYDVAEVYESAVQPMLDAKENGKCLIISTPQSTNGFWRMWKAADEGMDDWKAFKYNAYDNPFTNLKRLETTRKNARSQVKFNQEYLCEVSASESCPFEYEYIQKARTSVMSSKPTVVYGIDIALGKGNQTGDWTAITGLDTDGHITYFDRFRIPSQTAQLARMDSLDKNILKVIDTSASSMGHYYFQALQNSGHYVEGMTYTNASKTDMVYEFVNAIEKEEVKVNDIIADEMQIYEAKLSKSNNYTFGNLAGKNNYDDSLSSCMMAYKYLVDFGLKSGGSTWTIMRA